MDNTCISVLFNQLPEYISGSHCVSFGEKLSHAGNDEIGTEDASEVKKFSRPLATTVL